MKWMDGWIDKMYCITDIYFYMKIYIVLYTIYCMNDTYLYAYQYTFT